MAGANTNFDGLSRLHGGDGALSQDAPVKEGVAGPIREFDEPEAFVGVEPLDDPVDGWTGRCLEPGLAEPGPGSESMGLWVVGISVEVATPRMTEILISQLWFPGGFVPDQPGRATSGRVVADPMGSWFRYDPKLIGKHRWSQRLLIRWLCGTLGSRAGVAASRPEYPSFQALF